MRVREEYRRIAQDALTREQLRAQREADAEDAKLRLLEQVLAVSEEMENALATPTKTFPKRLLQDWYDAMQIGKIRIMLGKFKDVGEIVAAAAMPEEQE